MRDRGPADVAETPDRVLLRIDGLETSTPNTARWTTKAGARKHAARNKMVRETVWARLLAAVGNKPRTRGIGGIRVTRFSRGRLDDDNLIAAIKYVRDGIAQALGIDDRWFSVHGADPAKVPFYVEQADGKPGILIEVEFVRREDAT